MNPWTNAPTTMSNQYFVELLDTKWTPKKWDGPLQYEDPSVRPACLECLTSVSWPSVSLHHCNPPVPAHDQQLSEDLCSACRPCYCPLMQVLTLMPLWPK